MPLPEQQVVDHDVVSTFYTQSAHIDARLATVVVSTRLLTITPYLYPQTLYIAMSQFSSVSP